MLAAAAQENPVPWVRLWVRSFTECGLAARNLRAVADVARALWALLVVDPEIVSLEDILVGAFLSTVSAGSDRPLAAIGATAIGLGMAVPTVANALRWRYPGQVQYCRARRLHWVEGGLVPLVAWLVGPVLFGGSVPGQGRTFLGDWAREPSRRLLLVEGWLPNVVGAAFGHTVGVTANGHVFCTTFGHFWSGYGAEEIADVLIRRLQRVWQVWYLVLPPQDLVGTRPRVLGADGFPVWHWRVGEERLWTVVVAALEDWRRRRTPVRRFIEEPAPVVLWGGGY